MEKNETRKLEIKIAQLNAELQFDLAAFFGLFAGSIAFDVLGYELLSYPIPLLVFIFVSGFVLLCIAGYYLYRLNKCLKAFKDLR